MQVLRQTGRWIGANFAAIAFAVALAIPAAVAIRGETGAAQENRGLAQLPPRPQGWAEALKYTESLDRWINDHFGFRSFFVRLNNRLRYSLFRQFPTIQVIAGREGRIFLSAHATYQQPFSAITVPCGYTPANVDRAAASLGHFISTLNARGLDARVLIAPSSPVLNADQLPRWLEQACAASTAPIPAVLKSPRLDAPAHEFVFYPINEMRNLQLTTDVFPKTWFHWSGAGPRAVAGFSAERFWSIDPQAGKALAAATHVQRSDISHLFPGVFLASEILVADYAASGVQYCRGPQCFPDLTSVATKLGEVHTYRNPGAPAGRLVILSDSFGQFIAGWYSRYFREVLHLSTNSVDQLDAGEVAQLRDFVHASPNTKLLFVYHDGSILDERLTRDLAKLAP